MVRNDEMGGIYSRATLRDYHMTTKKARRVKKISNTRLLTCIRADPQRTSKRAPW